MKKILIVCPHAQGLAPSQRLKYEQYLPFLQSRGYATEISAFFSPRAYRIMQQPGRLAEKAFWTLLGYLRRGLLIARLGSYDGIYVHLYVTPLGGATFEKLYRRFARKLVYDIDDLVHLSKTSPHNAIVRRLKTSEKYFYLMRHADHVVTCTPYLTDIVRKHNDRVTDISSTVDTHVYRPANRYRNDRTVVLGWSGSVSTGPYLMLLQDVFTTLARRFDFKVLVIGAARCDLHGVDVELVPWREATETADLQRIDIGLYPLPDEEWVLGKSGLKAIQYMALGIPVVATAIGANFRVIEHGVSGYLATSPAEWVDALSRLLSQPETRRRLGENARRRVETGFSLTANQSSYLKVFDAAYGADPDATVDTMARKPTCAV